MIVRFHVTDGKYNTALMNGRDYLIETFPYRSGHCLIDLWEKHFNVKVVDIDMYSQDLIFESEEAFTAFLLRFS